MNDQLAATADLLSEPARASILLTLMNGVALPAGELAFAANVAPQTASGHLAKLLKGQFICVERQGRHRYYRLSGAEVAAAIEALLVLAPTARLKTTRTMAPPATGTLAHARTCYAHLAGWLGVRITDAFLERGLLLPNEGKIFTITENGTAWFRDLGVELQFSRRSDKKLARACLDWTERRPHLAGPLGVALHTRLLNLGWLAPIKSSRAVRVTVDGKRELWDRLRIPVH